MVSAGYESIGQGTSAPFTYAAATLETYISNGCEYDKCRICGSMIFRQKNHMYTETPNMGSDAQGAKLKIQGLKVMESGCCGICMRYDSRSCGGNRCKACDVSAAGLCCKRHLAKNANSNILERDGGDYRSLIGGFVRQQKTDGAHDDALRKSFAATAAKADAYRDSIYRQINGSDDKALVFKMEEYALKDFLVMLPHVDRRPVRIEIQLLIFMLGNYRYPIEPEYVETRFHISKIAINRYLRTYFGYTYASLLAKIRNEHSKTLLRIPLLRIGEIGGLVGYKSHYHYSLSFKRYEGISPKEYRQSAVGGAPLVRQA